MRRKLRLRPFEVGVGVAVLAVKALGIAVVAALSSEGALAAVVWWLVADAVAFGLLALGAAWAVRIVLTRARAQTAASARAIAAVHAEVKTTREKQSRHEYHHALQLSELRREVAEVRSDTEFLASDRPAPRVEGRRALRVLMVTSNGAGLGHLTRCLALTDAFPADWSVDILTLSTGWRQVETDVARLHYFPSKDRIGLSQPEWHRRFSRALSELVDSIVPDVVLFDGTSIYRGVHEVARHRRIPLVWIVRGGWKGGIENDQTRRPELFADALLLPDDWAIGEEPSPVATGTLPVLRTPPLVHAPPPLAADAALEALGLTSGRRHVLVQLGAGNIDDIGEKLVAAVDAVAALGPDWQAVVVDSPISRELSALPDHVARITAYPLSMYYSAFEFVVVAAGYNTVQEILSLGIPALLVPNLETLTDDQERRAARAAERGLALCAIDVEQIADGVRALAEPEQRARLRNALAVLSKPAAAPLEVDAWIEDVIAEAWGASRVLSPAAAGAPTHDRADGADMTEPEMEQLS